MRRRKKIRKDNARIIISRYRKRIIQRFFEYPEYDYVIVNSVEDYEDIVRNFVKVFCKDKYLAEYEFDIILMLKEMVFNGIKANYKFFFYNSVGVPLDSEHSFLDLKKEFSDFIHYNWNNNFFNFLLNMGLYVKLFYKEMYGFYIFGVENNRPLSVVEKKKIKNVFKNIKKTESLQEFLELENDYLEGGGMGIFMIISSLRKMGLNYRSFWVYSNGKTTKSFLAFPRIKPKNLLRRIKIK